jgi:alpha-1,3/alpha-1,6-mannosyltransferase
VLLSINRFERKKGLSLALRCLAELQRAAAAGAPPLHLVLAGGFDPRLEENVAHLAELRAEAAALGVAHAVTFVPSFRDEQKAALLAAATLVLYTPQARNGCAAADCALRSRSDRASCLLCPPQNEHFGLVPLEAMAAQRPVVACASGGPKESVVDGLTGFLCDATPAAFAHAAQRLLADPACAWRARCADADASRCAADACGACAVAERAGVAARQHVEKSFSRAAFGARLDAVVRGLVA